MASRLNEGVKSLIHGWCEEIVQVEQQVFGLVYSDGDKGDKSSKKIKTTVV
jgi:hypothetical protein